MRIIRLCLKTWTFGLKKGLQYPTNVYISLVRSVPSFWFAAILWVSITEQTPVIGMYDLSSLLQFYLVTRMLAAVMSFETDWRLWDDIKDGRLSHDLLRPVNCLLFRFARQLGQDAINITSFPVLMAVGYLVLPVALTFPVGPSAAGLSLIAVINGIILAKLLAYLRGALAFWLHDAGPFAGVDRVVIGVLSGYFIPLGVLPEAVRSAVLVLPFQGILNTPVEILIGVLDINTAFRLTVINLGWTLTAGAGLWLVWRRGLRRYEALGG